MKKGCFRGRASRCLDSTFERMMRKYEWRLWMGFEWSPGFSSSIRRSLGRFRPRAWRWRLKIWPNRIWPGESARKGQNFHDTAGIIIFPYCKFNSESPRIYSYAELYIATKGFSKDELLGSGGFGSVYRAVLPSDGSIVAVKCVLERGQRRLEKTFEAELAAVGQLRHKNLVSLKGWCFEEDELLLVYDYMPNSSLNTFLFARKGPVLEWERRYKIVGGLAAALCYLHEQLETQILHRDVKASNVMLDSGFNARLGDFGLARWLEHAGHQFETQKTKNYNQNSIRDFRLAETSRIGGTIGYLSPESLQRHSKSTTKSDVFSFGVVALEVASGRRAIDLSYPDEEIVLVDWIRGLYEDGRLLDAGDSRLPDGSYNLQEMNRLLHIGLLCSLNDPSARPTMKWIIQALDGDVDLPPLPSFKALPFYASLSSGSSESLSITDNNDFSKLLTSSSSGSPKPKFVSSDGEEKKSNGVICRNYAQLVDAPREFSLREVLTATENFAEEMMVAEMDFGTAYRGVLRGSNMRVLVKRLGMKTCPALRSRFARELHNLGRLRHRNLVQLRGWCTEKGEVLVIYDYMMNRSLSKMLFFQKKSFVLDWVSRYHVVKGLAAGLLYLHEEWEQTVVHKSVTSGNVFLDSDLNPRLGGFALAEFLNQNDDKHSSSGAVRGIFGYMSPEYVASGRATTDADVFSFGVVVLEVVCGKMAVDFRCPQVLLVEWIRNLEKNGMLSNAMDVRLQGRFDVREMARLLNVGLVCTRRDSKARPTMRQITHILDGDDRLLMTVQALSANSEPEKDSTSGDAVSLIKRMQALGIQ